MKMSRLKDVKKHTQKTKYTRLKATKVSVKQNRIMVPEEMSSFATKMSVKIPVLAVVQASSCPPKTLGNMAEKSTWF